MSGTAPGSRTGIRVRGSDSLNALLACQPQLLEFTFDQLRTLVVVQETGSANGAAQVLGREQSSVQNSRGARQSARRPGPCRTGDLNPGGSSGHASSAAGRCDGFP